jgi:acyl carrier protein
MSQEEILQALRSIAQHETDITELPTGDLQESLDSVQRMSLMVAIEDHFLIIFDPEEESQLETLDDLVAMIHKKSQEIDEHV